MAYRLEPQVAGELGADTVLDSSTHPPTVSRVHYVLDQPDTDELVESFPVFLISTSLGSRLQNAHATGFKLAKAIVRPSEGYRALYRDAPHREYLWMQVRGTAGRSDFWLDESFRMCVSDRAMAILETAKLSDCLVEQLA
jgi:hypothetical protein